LTKTFISKKRKTKITCSDHYDRPGLVCAQDVTHGVDEFVATIANSRVAELPKKSQVFSYLSVTEAKKSPELTRRDGFFARRLKPL
jgi:hypothetical protein